MRVITESRSGKSVYFSKRGRRIVETQLLDILALVIRGEAERAIHKYNLTSEDVAYLIKWAESGKQ